ncbi:MAG: KH domain-containing protein [bacterium]
MKEYLEHIIRSLVDNPDQVDIREVAGSRTMVYELRVAQSDLGKVIGKQGQTAKAIRLILSAASARKGMRAVLEILED